MPAHGPQHQKRPGYKEVGSWGWDDNRLWSKIDKNPDHNGCHNWQGAMSPSGGLMGAWKIDGHQQMTQARRLVFMSKTNEDVTPYQVRLKCANQACCNPEHFELKKNYRGRQVYGN